MHTRKFNQRKKQGRLFDRRIPTLRDSEHAAPENVDKLSKALRHAAYARREDVDTLLEMLTKDPGLLLLRGCVKTPGGLVVDRVTIYELLLGAGDFDFAERVLPFFKKLPNGDAERAIQFERYRPHLEGMFKQKPYDIQPIFDSLLNPKDGAQVTRILVAEFLGGSEWSDGSEFIKKIIKFQNDHIPSEPLTEPRMHFNYATQNAIYDKLRNEDVWGRLRHVLCFNGCEMTDVVCIKLIGYLMNFYPGIDRCMMTQPIGDILTDDGTLKPTFNRSYQLTNNRGEKQYFPDFGQSLFFYHHGRGKTCSGQLGIELGISAGIIVQKGNATAFQGHSYPTLLKVKALQLNKIMELNTNVTSAITAPQFKR